MARIAFLQGEYEDKLGVLYLVAYLKAQGHYGEIFIERRGWFDEIKNFKPDIIGFSCLTGGHLWVEVCAKRIKRIINGIFLSLLADPTLLFSPDGGKSIY